MDHVFQQIGRKVMLLSGRHIPSTHEMPERLLLTIEDITDRERDREELRTLNIDLEQRVTDGTALAEHRSQQLRSLASDLVHSEQRERDRLARVLHDNLQQLLIAAKLQLGSLSSRVQDERSQRAVTLIEDLLTQSLDTSRSLTVELSPILLSEAGLHAALPWLGRKMEAQQGLLVQMEINAKVEQDEEGVALLLFQAVRELLLNVVKHTGVGSARVSLDRIDGDLVRIVVSDEGAGFHPAILRASEDLSTGLGLSSLKERLEHVGGRCEIDSAPGRGTRVTLVARISQPGKPLTRAMVAPDRVRKPGPSAT